MKKAGTKIEYEEDTSPPSPAGPVSPAVNVRSSGSQQSTPAESPRVEHVEPTPNPAIVSAIPKLQELVTAAAKLINHNNAQALIPQLFAIVSLAKNVSEQLPVENDVISYARALQGATNTLRTRTDGGSKIVFNKTEITDALGNLYINIVGLS